MPGRRSTTSRRERSRDDAAQRSSETPPLSAFAISWRAGLIVLAGAIAYANSLTGPFLFDDDLTVVQSRTIGEWWRLGTVLLPQRESPVAGRPLVNLSFALNYAVGGLDVRGYHIGNIAVHLACALLVFAIVRRTLTTRGLSDTFGSRSTNLALAAALIWELHPLNTEAVDYLTQRTESMMALFYLLTLYASIRALASHRLRWEGLAVASCALGMACKESMVTAPLMVVLYDAVFTFDSAGSAWRARWKFYLGLAATWTVVAALTWSGPRMYSAGFTSKVDPWTYLLNQAVMIIRYLRLALWPRPLVLLYGPPLPLTLRDVLPQALLVTALLLLTIVALVRRPALGFLGAWFFVTLAPTSSVLPISTEVAAERRMYLPLIALVALGVVAVAAVSRYVRHRWADGFTDGRGRAPSLLTTSLLIVCAAPLAASTILRNRDYASGLSMAQNVLERWPTPYAHYVLGSELATLGRHEEAVTEYRLAADGLPRARYYLGSELFTKGQLDEATADLQEFIRQEPLLAEVIPAHLKIGQAYSMQGRSADAIEQFQLVLSMTPSNVDVQVLLAEALAGRHAFDEAIPHYRQYLASRPNDVGALTGLGIAMSMSEKYDKEVVSVFRRAVELAPENASIRTNLARALAINDDFAEAARQAQRAVELTPDNSSARDLLGGILASQGRFGDARVQYARALQLDPSDGPARQALEKISGRADTPHE